MAQHNSVDVLERRPTPALSAWDWVRRNVIESAPQWLHLLRTSLANVRIDR